MNKNSKIFVAGHNGMVGSAIIRNLSNANYQNLITYSSKEFDLRNQEQVTQLFSISNPEIVIIAAAKVGGILANDTYRAEFLYDNLMIEANLIHASYLFNVKKLIFLGSSCIYPKMATQPIKEEYLLTNRLENTNEPYAIAKIAGVKLCESYYKQYGSNFISLMPTNLYGYNDNFNLNTSHVLPALIKKFDKAKRDLSKTVEVWGSGSPKREFLFVDDLSEAIRFTLENINAIDLYENKISHLNIGTGKDISIKELSEIIANVVEFDGEIIFDTTKPDGTPKKLLDVSRINQLGWKHKIDLSNGIKMTYEWYRENSPK